MAERKYKFDDPKAAFAEAEKRIQQALETGAKELTLDHGFGLTELPKSIAALTKLEHLRAVISSPAFHAGDNSAGDSLPDFVCGLKELRTLDLDWYGLNAVPEAIRELSRLSSLRIKFTNRPTSLPNSLGQLAQLENLEISAGRMKVLPDSIGNLTRLQRLDVSANHLTSLPDSVGRLAKLRILNVSMNQLERLPESLGDLQELEELMLYENRLNTLPDSLGKLKRLKALAISLNAINSLPESLAGLVALETFDVSGNNLTSVPGFLCSLANLRFVGLGENKLTHLPDALGRLTQLEFLNLSNHGQFYLFAPPRHWLSTARGSLSRNNLGSLPPSFRALKSLKELYLHGNRSLGLPAEVLGPSLEAVFRKKSKPAEPAGILDYYFRVCSEGRRPLNEAKLILLGRGEVGKTCIVNRLLYDKFKRTSMTRGIAIAQWPVTTGKDTVRLHVWDFGGQEIQHATHQFFLTERSLYLVVLNGRAGAEDEDAEYWLKFVKTFGASSPTIAVLNKFKVQPFQVNRRALQEKYPFIRAFVETDCKPKTKNGIPELKREIESALAAMEHVRADFPAGWFQIKERLAEMKEPFIAFAEYREICAGLGENDSPAQERLAGFLNALGIALNFREDPQLREETVLNPHWITKGVYQIITSKALAERQGELPLADLGRILPKKAYPPRMHGFLIELMRKFELCFPYHDDVAEHRYLVPELLGKEQPALKEPFPPGECLHFRYDYRLMPEGLLPRFITRTHTMSEPAERWRTGVVLRWEGCRALVKADKQERQVLVRVLGEPQKRRRLLAVIRENFDQIHAEMKEFKPTEWVALEGHPEEWVSFGELEKLEKGKVSEFPKPVGDDVVSVNVTNVLNGTDVPGARERGEAPAGERRPLKLFISYAHEDERWRAKLAPNLDLLQREGLVEVWCDLQIKPGDKWDDEIKRKLEEAELYLFLMSTDLLVSDYVRNTELPIARKRHEENTARLVPVIVRECSWTGYVGDIQGLPKGTLAVKQWRDKDQAFHDVEMGLRKTIVEVRKLLGRDS